MSNTRIAIKRSATNSTIPALFQGELCYSQNGTGTGATSAGTLYVGRPSDNAAIAIGGVYNYGTLTACQAVVTNATSYTDKFLTANLTAANAFLSIVYANGAVGVSGNVLMSNATGGVYWGTTAVGGVNMAFGNGVTCTTNPFLTSGTTYANLSATPGLNFATGGLQVFVGNGLIVNSSGVCANLAASPGLTFTSGGLAVSPGATIAVGATVTVNLAATPGLIGTTGLAVNLATTSGLSLTSGLTTVVANGMSLTAAGLNVNAAATSGLVSNASGLWVQAANALTINATGFIAVNVATTSGLVSNASGLWAIGNNGISVTTGGIFANLGDSSLKFASGGLAANLAATPGLTATAGIAVKSDTAISVSASGTQVNLASTPGLITTSGLAVKPDSATSVGAGGIQVNTTGTSSGLSTAGGLALVVNTSQFVLTTGGLTHNATGVVTLQDLTLAGNLTVSGTMTTLDTTTLTVKDNMIVIADQQATTASFLDAVDSGFYVTTGNSGTQVFSGIARIASLSTNTNPCLKIFSTNSAVNSTIINATASMGTLQSYLTPWGAGGAFVVNSSSITLICNSTVGVALTANSLSLTTALPVSNIAAGTDGQVLQYATGSGNLWGSLDGGTF